MRAQVIAQRLRNLRADKTLDAVAKGTGLTAQALSNYESAIRIPRDEAKVAIANYYGKTVGEIFFDEKVHETKTRGNDDGKRNKDGRQHDRSE